MVTRGAVVSRTTTLNASLVPVLPALSVAEQDSVVVPTGKPSPEAYDAPPEVVHVTGRTPSTASKALAENSTGVRALVASTGRVRRR